MNLHISEEGIDYTPLKEPKKYSPARAKAKLVAKFVVPGLLLYGTVAGPDAFFDRREYSEWRDDLVTAETFACLEEHAKAYSKAGEVIGDIARWERDPHLSGLRFISKKERDRALQKAIELQSALWKRGYKHYN